MACILVKSLPPPRGSPRLPLPPNTQEEPRILRKEPLVLHVDGIVLFRAAGRERQGCVVQVARAGLSLPGNLQPGLPLPGVPLAANCNCDSRGRAAGPSGAEAAEAVGREGAETEPQG